MQVPFWLALLGYLTALLARRRPKLSTAAIAVALPSHLFALPPWLKRGEALDLGLLNALLLIVWLLAATTTLSRLFKRPTGRFAQLFWFLALMTLILRALFPELGTHLTRPSPGLAFHIATSMLAFSLLTIAALLAIWTAGLDFKLRHPLPDALDLAAPPLERLERLTFRLVAVGFALLTLSLLSGLLFVEDLFGQHLVHKTFFSLIAWTLFGSLLYGRWRYGWRGRMAVRLTLAGFSALLLAYLMTKWVVEVLLGG